MWIGGRVLTRQFQDFTKEKEPKCLVRWKSDSTSGPCLDNDFTVFRCDLCSLGYPGLYLLFSGYIGPLTSVRVHGVSTLVDIILPTEPLLAVSDLQSLLELKSTCLHITAMPSRISGFMRSTPRSQKALTAPSCWSVLLMRGDGVSVSFGLLLSQVAGA